MGSDWPKRQLADLCDPDRKIAYGILKVGDFVSDGIPVIRGGDVREGRVVFDDDKRVTQEISNQFSRTILKGGEIVINLISEPGHSAIVPKGFSGYNVSRDVAVIPLGDSVDHRYVDYFLRSRWAIDWLTARLQGSVTQKINIGTLRELPVPIPPLAEQKRIAGILGALDDKIELNRKMNETLEQMAKVLFKSWFVDFDPVHAKAVGRQPASMDKATADLFPDSFVDSELGKVPKGWEVSELGQIADVIDCLHAKKPEASETGQLYLQLNNIRDDGLIDISETFLIGLEDYKKWTSRMEATEGDCVITNVGRVGAVAQIPQGMKAALGRNITGIRCKPIFTNPTFLIECLMSEEMREEIRRKTDTGTILDALNVKSIPKLRFIRPPLMITERFERLARPLRHQMERGVSQSRTLTDLRDTLLPKLLSGDPTKTSHK